jgi:hypothetical protein
VTLLSSLIARGRSVAVALALGATAVTAMPAPALAQNFTFDFEIRGGGADFSWGTDRRGRRIKRDCLTNSEVRRGLRRLDFEDIRFIDRRGRRVTVIAQYDPNNRWYEMNINTCTGRVTDIERVRVRYSDDDYDGDRRGRGGDRDRDDDVVLY